METWWDNHVEVIDRGQYDEDGHILWVLVDDYDRSSARVSAESLGEVLESDITDDGRWSFVVRAFDES